MENKRSSSYSSSPYSLCRHLDHVKNRSNLRVGEPSIERESPNTVEIRLTARYKPDDEDDHETDQLGYTKTEPLTALRITDLTETEADLIKAFVPVAVDDVREGLESYTETVEHAEELEAKIERTDGLIEET
jgi:hypothetical protein